MELNDYAKKHRDQWIAKGGDPAAWDAGYEKLMAQVMRHGDPDDIVLDDDIDALQRALQKKHPTG